MLSRTSPGPAPAHRRPVSRELAVFVGVLTLAGVSAGYLIAETPAGISPTKAVPAIPARQTVDKR